VTPNQLTALRVLVGISAAVAMAAGEIFWMHLGASLFVFSMLLDRADGDLARTKKMTSAAGHTYDLYADAFCNAIIFVGIGVGLRDGAFAPWAMPMGLVAGLSVGTILLLVMHIESLEGARAAEIGGFAGFDPDDAMLFIPLAVWFGFAEQLLAAAAIGAPSFAIFFVWLFRKKLSAAKDDQAP
jgi:archaetidylinositol phosphate synthase